MTGKLTFISLSLSLSIGFSLDFLLSPPADDYGNGNRERHQPLLHFTEDRDDLGSPGSSKKNKRKAKKKGKQYESIRSKYYEDV
mmetsp:Transcript_7051/g.18185  ORF Transcript_7051/g.18185 Transcript_7051/m.18185 type:complete len:84 (-) Transcript_7051:153-404(-)